MPSTPSLISFFYKHSVCSLNLPSHLLCWLCSYLTIRTQQAAISGYFSTLCHASSGVPQGSILGLLLFILYINYIFGLPLSPSTTHTLYADNILFSHPVSSASSLHVAQSDLITTSSSLSSPLLTINSSKSDYYS